MRAEDSSTPLYQVVSALEQYLDAQTQPLRRRADVAEDDVFVLSGLVGAARRAARDQLELVLSTEQPLGLSTWKKLLDGKVRIERVIALLAADNAADSIGNNDRRVLGLARENGYQSLVAAIVGEQPFSGKELDRAIGDASVPLVEALLARSTPEDIADFRPSDDELDRLLNRPATEETIKAQQRILTLLLGRDALDVSTVALEPIVINDNVALFEFLLDLPNFVVVNRALLTSDILSGGAIGIYASAVNRGLISIEDVNQSKGYPRNAALINVLVESGYSTEKAAAAAEQAASYGDYNDALTLVQTVPFSAEQLAAVANELSSPFSADERLLGSAHWALTLELDKRGVKFNGRQLYGLWRWASRNSEATIDDVRAILDVDQFAATPSSVIKADWPSLNREFGNDIIDLFIERRLFLDAIAFDVLISSDDVERIERVLSTLKADGADVSSILFETAKKAGFYYPVQAFSAMDDRKLLLFLKYARPFDTDEKVSLVLSALFRQRVSRLAVVRGALRAGTIPVSLLVRQAFRTEQQAEWLTLFIDENVSFNDDTIIGSASRRLTPSLQYTFLQHLSSYNSLTYRGLAALRHIIDVSDRVNGANRVTLARERVNVVDLMLSIVEPQAEEGMEVEEEEEEEEEDIVGEVILLERPPKRRRLEKANARLALARAHATARRAAVAC